MTLAKHIKVILTIVVFGIVSLILLIFSFQFFRTCYGIECLQRYKVVEGYRIPGIACFTAGGMYFPDQEYERYPRLARRYFNIQYVLIGDRLIAYSKNEDRYIVLKPQYFYKSPVLRDADFCEADFQFQVDEKG